MAPLSPLRSVDLLSNLALLIAAACFSAGYIRTGLFFGAVLTLALVLFWLFARQRGHMQIFTSLLLGWTLLAVAGMSLGVAAFWILIGYLGILAAHDLEGFAVRLQTVNRLQDPGRLVATHLRRLLGVTGAGLVLGSAALVAGLSIDFGSTALLSGIVIFCLILGIGFLRFHREKQR